MVPTLLVPLDGSPSAESALPCASLLASRIGGEIVLLRAALAHTLPGVSPEAAQTQAVSEAELYLSALETRLQAAGHRVRSVVAYGPAAEVIVDNADLQRADMLVMVAHGQSGSRRWDQGSVADKVLRGVGLPVLLIRGTDDCPPKKLLSGVLLPLDGSAVAEGILPRALALSRHLGTRLVLLAVLPPVLPAVDEPSPSAQSLKAFVAQAGEYLARVQIWLEEQGASVSREIRRGAPADEILDRAQCEDIGLIALSTHGRSGVGRWVYGSVADRVLHGAECPVLLVRAPGAQPQPAQGAPVAARHCHNCDREVSLETLATTDRCPLCGFQLRSCANCANYDGVICAIGNPQEREIYVGTACADFTFRETIVPGSSALRL